MSGGPSSSFLVLRFEAPLQAWGERAQWTLRDTATEPTKSGVVGLLAACLGWGRDQDESIAELAHVLVLGVRVDRPGRLLVDYHTVGGGEGGGVMSAEGKIKRNATTKEPETVVSERHYLADAAFTVVLGGPAEWLDRLATALANPVWPPFLGRKSCPPAVPLLPRRVHSDSLEAVLRAEPFRPRFKKEWLERLRCVVDAIPELGHDLPGLYTTRQDVPLSLAVRRFGFRTVREFQIPTPMAGGVADASDVPIPREGR